MARASRCRMDALFAGGPLVRQSNNITAGVSVAWSLWESAERVDRPIDE